MRVQRFPILQPQKIKHISNNWVVMSVVEYFQWNFIRIQHYLAHKKTNLGCVVCYCVDFVILVQNSS